jgi:hypothetical protein
MDCVEWSVLYIECIKRPHGPIKDKTKCKSEFDAYTECVKTILIPQQQQNNKIVKKN